MNLLSRFISTQFRKPRGLFGHLTSKWMVKGNRNNYTVLLKALNIQPCDKILEVGYGPGIGINMIASTCTSCKIYGIDFSKLMYRKATKTNQKFINDEKVELFYGDFLSTHISTNNFDKIFCINVVYFWNDLQPPFKKIKGLLKQGGSFQFYMAHPDFIRKLNPADDIFNKYSIEQVISALSMAGFTKVHYYFNKGYYVTAGV